MRLLRARLGAKLPETLTPHDAEWIKRLIKKTKLTKPPKDEHAQKVDGKCWTFTGYIKNSHGRDQENGYPYMRYGKRLVRAHKHIMEILGHTYTRTCVTEHMCRNRRCVNPHHLEVISVQENTLRGLTGEQLRTQRCRQCGSHDGHTVQSTNKAGNPIKKWVCRPCRNKRKREYRRSKEDARKQSPQHEFQRRRAGSIRSAHDEATSGRGHTGTTQEQGPASAGDKAPAGLEGDQD